jgi:hypothetical protein
MSEIENFISRWSRLKGAPELKRKPEVVDLCEADVSSAAATGAASEGAGADTQRRAAPAFDPASLPPIDSITALTDIRPFLQLGVPVELTRAALRRTWVSDPAIRNFIGVAENQWDFTDPAAIPGFGPLQDSSAESGFIAQALGRLDKSLDGSSVRLPDNGASADKPQPAMDNSQRDEIDNKTSEAQPASVAQMDQEASGLAPENNRLAPAPHRGRSGDSMSPEHHRHAHGDALPR